MAKDNFDLRAFLVENKMTVTSRGNELRKHFLAEGTGCGADLEEKKAKRGTMHSLGVVDVPSGIYEAEDLEETDDINVNVDDEDFIDPAELPGDSLGLLEGTLDDRKREIFDKLGIDQESFNKFVQQAVGATHGNVQKALKIVQKAYPLSERQIRFLVDKGIIDWTRSGFGATSRDLGRRGGHGGTYRDFDTYTGKPLAEDFSDIANAAAREQDRYADVDDEEPEAAPDVFGGLGSTSYEAPEDLDLGGADEESIRRSYTSLKNQGIDDERAMRILAKTYDIPEETLKSMFKDVFRNAREKAVQVDEPKEKVSTFRMPKRGSAAEKAAAADMGGEFDDTEDPDEFAKPGETDDDDEETASKEEPTAAGVSGDIDIERKDGNGTVTLHVPGNFSMEESEEEIVTRLKGYPKGPEVTVPYLQRAINKAQKEAAAKGNGTAYLWLCTDGAYHAFPQKGRAGDIVQVTKSNGNVIDTKLRTCIASIDCSGAPVTMTRRQAADAAKTDAQVATATSGYGSMELSDDEIQNYVQSKAWNAKSIEQKLRDEYFPWSEEAKEYMDDDEIADAKAELKNETPVDPESDWAKEFASRR